MSESAGANWYPDPQNPGQQRWWDGSRWTDATQPDPSAGAAGGAGGWSPTQQPGAAGWQQQTVAGSGGYQQPSAGGWQQAAPGSGGYQQPEAGGWQQAAPGSAGYQQPGGPASGGWPGGTAPLNQGWQQPGENWYGSPMPVGPPGQRPGGRKGLMYGLIGGGAVLALGLVIGLIVAFHGSGGSKPTAQSSNVGTTQPSAGTGTTNPGAGTSPGAQSQSAQCTKDIAPLAQQMVNISKEVSSDPSAAVTLINQEANLYNQAAANASGDPPLKTDLSNVATDLSDLGTDVSNGDSASEESDVTQLETDVTTLEQLCGTS